MHTRISYNFYKVNKVQYIIANEDKKLVYLGWKLTDFLKKFPNALKESHAVQEEVFTQLCNFLDGKSKTFKIEAKFYGTDFQKQVWNEIANIKYGKLTTYGELAKKLGRPKSSRAVGAALGKNPIAIIYPCHRIIGKNGSLTGFAGGVELKKQLLLLEGSF